MLDLRPTCEHCDKPLPPESPEARICSFECTFCRDCVEHVLAGVCPNCGGNFVPRPIRPVQDWKNGNFLGRYPASTKLIRKPVDARPMPRWSSGWARSIRRSAERRVPPATRV